MRIALSLFLFLSSHLWGKCEFHSEVKKVFSLSGPMTVALKELDLLSQPKLLGISIFNPISGEQFKGKILPGGIFLSPSLLQEFSNGIVFFDESLEMSRTFSTVPHLKVIEIKTRGLSPAEVQASLLHTLKPYVAGCEDNFKKFNKRFKQTEDELLTFFPVEKKMVFYLGEFKGSRAPELLIVNDGVVKWLKDQKKISTYPSELAYVSWSAKLMRELPKETWHIGVRDSARSLEVKVVKIQERRVNLTYPGALVSGISQLDAWLTLMKAL